MNTNTRKGYMKTSYTAITPHDALLLQQISEDGEDDLASLSAELREPRKAVLARIHALRAKGLITIIHNYQDVWVRLSRRGKYIVRDLWPETRFAA